MKLGFIMCGDTERIVLKELNREIATLRADQTSHVEHLLRSWRVSQGMLWEPATACVRAAIRRAKRDRP
jgi:hypothetical protein